MKRFLFFALTIAVAAGLAACSSENLADPNNQKSSALLSSPRPPSSAPKITIPAGTKLAITMIDGVSTEKSSRGDKFLASLSRPIVINGKTVLESGTKVRGHVVDVEDSGRVRGRASISLVLTSIVRNGKEIEISTKPFAAMADATKKRDAAVIGGGAGVGALVGAIAGGKKGAGIGALVGGGAGTGAVLATKGKELHYPPETRITFTLSDPVQI
jgi:hypothetical protein